MISVFSVSSPFPAEVRCFCHSQLWYLFSTPTFYFVSSGTLSSGRWVIFSYSHEERKRFPPDIFLQVYFSRYIFFLFAMPRLCIPIFQLQILPALVPIEHTPTALTACRVFLSFPICRQKCGRMKGVRNNGVEGNSACLCLCGLS